MRTESAGPTFGGLLEACRIVLEWLPRLFWLNLLWIGLSLLGGVVLGACPATAAMFTVVRRWVRRSGQGSTARMFWSAYREEFWQANLVGLVMAAAAVGLIVDLRAVPRMAGSLAPLFEAPVIVLSLAYCVVLVNLWPVFVHFRSRWVGHLRLAFLVGLSHPLRTVLMASEVAVAVLLTRLLQGASICLAGAVLALLLTWTAQGSFPPNSAEAGLRG
jgi:uncharacterized membrane protein YesL